MPKDPNTQLVEQNAEEIYTAHNKSMTKGRGGNSNFPQVTNDKPEDARRVLSEVIKWYKMPRAESDEEIEQRTDDFFLTCINGGERPTVEKYCLAIGYARSTVNEWEHGLHCTVRRTNIIKRAKEVLAAYDAGMAVEGKLNPVPYIFRAKNYYGLSDTTNLVVTPQNPLGEEQPAEQIAETYKQLPED